MGARVNTQGRERQKVGKHSEIIGIVFLGTNPMSENKNLHTKTRNRKIRQDTLREYMQERGSTQHLFDLIEKIENLDHESDTFNAELSKLKASADLRFKALAKYLPDLKSQEITAEGGDPLQIKIADFKNA